ncbi:MAG: hypothetical protein HYT70_00015 [Candidatus Aenigmarchaeota archaeon]|nr:hypothetical protein [Candidatus Aenigmarchaeota archaeon]
MNKNLIIVGLVVVIAALVVFMIANGIITLPGGSKYKTGEEVTNATVGIGSGVENVGSTLEEIDRSLG